MPKQIAIATVEGIRKKGRSRKGCRDEVEEDLNIIGIKNRQAVAKVHNKLWFFRNIPDTHFC